MTTTFIAHTVFITHVLYIKEGHAEDSRFHIKLCVLWTYNISSHEQGKECEEVFLKVAKSRVGMGLQGREWTAEAVSWIPHNLTIEEIICTAFVSIPGPLWKRLDYKKIKASSFTLKPLAYSLCIIWLHEASPATIWARFKKYNTACLSPSSLDGWLATIQCHIYTGVFSICGSLLLTSVKRGWRGN